ncbi:glycoside hydrolase family 97 N-terminal domain-containing protein, partial [uncultured Muribaculum sp.]
MNHLIPSVLLLLVLFSCKGSDIYQLASPDGRLSVKIEQTTDSGLMYRFFIDNKLVIGSSPLGYRLDGGRMLPDMQYKIVNNDYVAVNSEWHPVWGKRSVVPDVYNQLTLEFESKKDSARFVLDVRLYDDGFAFRYNIPEIGEEVCADEVTGFNYVENPVAWFYNGEDANYGPVRLTEVDTVRSPNVTLQLSDDLFLNMHEACLMQGDPLMLDSEKGEHSLVVASSAGVLGKLKSGYTSAWRVVMVGNTPGALVDSHLLELLNPDPDMDFSWVKPGIAVWDWRINGAEYNKFTYTMSYPSWVRMVDFAAEQGFGYLVLDANWYGPEFDSDSNPTNGHKAADVQRLLAYAKEKGVGVWLYLNDIGGRKFPIEETLSQYGRWGASGVKYGFMEGSPEEKNRWTQKITELCAKNRLLVDFHDGPVHPYGQMRTWPNAVTREYCHAQLDAHRVFTPSTFCTSVFVNMVAGPLDMNNGMFDLRQGPTTRIDENQP